MIVGVFLTMGQPVFNLRARCHHHGNCYCTFDMFYLYSVLNLTYYSNFSKRLLNLLFCYRAEL